MNYEKLSDQLDKFAAEIGAEEMIVVYTHSGGEQVRVCAHRCSKVTQIALLEIAKIELAVGTASHRTEMN